MSKRAQPVWRTAEAKKRPTLKLYNSLTRRKEEFVPLNGNNVTWYSCGPTVYDASHMGHARSYISFDILRRVLTNYFGFNVHYVMNITDIDDKIIKRARQNYLYEQYVQNSVKSNLEQLLAEQKEVLIHFQNICAQNANADKQKMLEKSMQRMNNAVESLTEAVKSKNEELIAKARQSYLSESKDTISEWLDAKEGLEVNDNSLFEMLPRYWENQFHIDMKALNILQPDVLTRVSEYVPQIVKFIEKIIENGFAYESNGSVYFDVNEFDKTDKHYYAKLVPEAYGDTKTLQEGEGDLSVSAERLSEKRSPNDFALWKTSKTGEPWWNSPWGHGRPGWHIECSAMASDIFGSKFDIHTGGVDLKFPHHDNELAQSEAAFDSSEWVKYFLHTGHLTIAGCKMSKSLKNFITIQEALEKNSATQLRLAFLMHSWKDTLDYSDKTMEMAVQYEKFLSEFFLNVKDITRNIDTEQPHKQFDKWTNKENALQQKLDEIKEQVHAALCDNIDTRTALDIIKDLVTFSNIYIRDNKTNINRLLLLKIAAYLTDILDIFGAIMGPRTNIGFPVSNSAECNNVGIENLAMPFIQTMADFRSDIREQAKLLKAFQVLKICDALRDDVLPNLGVRLEDKENGQYAVKLVNRESLLKEREAKKAVELERLAEAKRKKEASAEAALLKERQRGIDPKYMFLNDTDKYSAFDDNCFPTHDAQGKEISKGQIKKLQKLQLQQKQRYNDYIASQNNT